MSVHSRVSTRLCSLDRNPICPTWAVAGLLLALALAVQGAAPAASGNVTVPDGVTLTVEGPSGEQIVIGSKDGPAALPAAEYVVRKWVCESKDEKGRSWKLQLIPKRDTYSLVVAAGRSTALGSAPAIVSSLKVSRRNEQYTFWHSMKGERGEVVKLTCNGKRPPAPNLTIKTSDGTYEKSLYFGYG